jgi:putative FmdB family regulatory protein
MPVYQYACPDCGHRFEIKQKFNDEPVRKCPHCKKVHVFRVVGQVAVSFKGSGWYITDSKSSSEKHTLEHKKKEPSANGLAESTGTGVTETKTETKETEAATKPAEKAVADKPAEKAKKD